MLIIKRVNTLRQAMPGPAELLEQACQQIFNFLLLLPPKVAVDVGDPYLRVVGKSRVEIINYNRR